MISSKRSQNAERFDEERSAIFFQKYMCRQKKLANHVWENQAAAHRMKRGGFGMVRHLCRRWRMRRRRGRRRSGAWRAAPPPTPRPRTPAAAAYWTPRRPSSRGNPCARTPETKNSGGSRDRSATSMAPSATKILHRKGCDELEHRRRNQKGPRKACEREDTQRRRLGPRAPFPRSSASAQTDADTIPPIPPEHASPGGRRDHTRTPRNPRPRRLEKEKEEEEVGAYLLVDDEAEAATEAGDEWPARTRRRRSSRVWARRRYPPLPSRTCARAAEAEGETTRKEAV